MSRSQFCSTAASRILMLTLMTAPAVAQYEPPAGYYASATGTGASLKASLHAIMSTNYWAPGSTTHRVVSYDNARYGLQVTDADPLDPTKVVLFYTGNSVNGTWDAGATWNREHTWPVSLGVGSSGPDYSDMHMLRPCNPSVNSSRGNKPFGMGSGYWDPLASAWLPGVNHRGDAARAMFYAETRYDGGDANTVNLTLVNGFPSTNQMGDLARLLDWHYADPVDDGERRRNHLVFSSAENPSYFQGNRNPFVDRPEFVWAIWGTGPNTSTIFVGGAPDSFGGSNMEVTLRAIVGAPLPQQTITINKSGSTPTTYSLFPSSGFTIEGDLTGRAFPSGAQQAVYTVAAESTAAPGISVGAIIVDNTDLTSAGQGQGSDDDDDLITVIVEVLSPSVGSLDAGEVLNSALVEVEASTLGGVVPIPVEIHNFDAGSMQAMLDVTQVTGLSAPFAVQPALPTSIGETPGVLTLLFDPQGLSPGGYQAVATVHLSDEDIPGAQTSLLTVTLAVNLVAPCPGDANNDRIVDFNDVTTVIANWLADYAPGSGPGDANADGIVDFNDITTVISNWLADCN